MNCHMNSLVHSPGWNSLVNHLVIGLNHTVNHMVHTPCDSLCDSVDTVNYLVTHMVDSHGSSPGMYCPVNDLVNMNDLLNYPLNYLLTRQFKH